MSDEIRVGDVCLIVAPATADLVGTECEVIGEEKVYEKKIGEGPSFEVWAWCLGFLVRLASDGRRYVIERKCLRKKPPKADDSQWIRDQTVPRADFNRWLERVREAGKVEETA